MKKISLLFLLILAGCGPFEVNQKVHIKINDRSGVVVGANGPDRTWVQYVDNVGVIHEIEIANEQLEKE